MRTELPTRPPASPHPYVALIELDGEAIPRQGETWLSAAELAAELAGELCESCAGTVEIKVRVR